MCAEPRAMSRLGKLLGGDALGEVVPAEGVSNKPSHLDSVAAEALLSRLGEPGWRDRQPPNNDVASASDPRKRHAVCWMQPPPSSTKRKRSTQACAENAGLTASRMEHGAALESDYDNVHRLRHRSWVPTCGRCMYMKQAGVGELHRPHVGELRGD